MSWDYYVQCFGPFVPLFHAVLLISNSIMEKSKFITHNAYDTLEMLYPSVNLIDLSRVPDMEFIGVGRHDSQASTFLKKLYFVIKIGYFS